ncbi:hypothetical protein JCM19037_1541 [Geomicrobium sp. JCM 19037]|uniref:hypothetical protein n=1 Tax=Geomicrobium sp. JCM 19037 TaxID=1460634 RepID=UPI00045F1A77|nr:hypothetical protein [Geomicrobium sp. JCM 19037]GAK03236.1 hypothetical protein JCM19037_1541 [Geomicrobium sp. JCM 19037]
MGKRMIGVLLLALSTIGFTFLMLPVGQWLDETILRASSQFILEKRAKGYTDFLRW